MLKKLSPVLILSLLLTGCAATLTNLTPLRQVRNSNNLYPVEVALSSRQQSLIWSSIRPKIVVGKETYEMHPTPVVTDRWEGLVPVPPGASAVRYRYKFDFDYYDFGQLKTDSAMSEEYTLRIIGK